MRKALNIPSKFKAKIQVASLMANGGINIETLSQLLNTNYAQNITNYIITAEGQLIKRKGIKLLAEKTGITGINMIEFYHDNTFIISYGTTASAVDIVTGTITEIKTNWTTSDVFNGVKYGDYFYACNGGNKIFRISRTLNYDGQGATNFTANLKITGGTSGATATILEDADSGATGTLTLGNVLGTFQNDELITDTGTGSATVNGTIGYTATEVTNAPKAKILYNFIAPAGSSAGARLFAGNIGSGSGSSITPDVSKVCYSSVDTGANPPYATWSAGVLATDPNSVFFRNAGAVTTIASLGSQVIIGYENGKMGFRITAKDVGGSLTQDVEVDFQNLEAGMARGAITTSKGIFYGTKASKAGFYLMTSGGQTNNPYTEQSNCISTLLGVDYFKKADFTNLSIAYDTKNNLVLFTYGNDSTINNEVFVYNINTKSITIFTGWNISRFITHNDIVYGVSHLDGKIYQLFENYDDNGKDISTSYKQEIKLNGLNKLWALENFIIQSTLGEDAIININFDIYDRDGNEIQGVNNYKITGTTPINALKEWGSSGYGSSGYGSGIGGGSVKAKPYQLDTKIPELWRLSIKILNTDKLPHSINFFQALLEDRGENLLLNNITQII